MLTGNLRDALNHLSRIEFIENQEVILWVGCFDISFLDRIWREVLQIEGNNQRTSRTDGGGKNVPVLRIVGQAREDVLVIIIDGVRKKTPDFPVGSNPPAQSPIRACPRGSGALLRGWHWTRWEGKAGAFRRA
ncbi:MAG: hypothetical protein EAZ42_02375 [Verrucomicrobia bacterium]|nr:MAG: hypothetical protein EAZ42_02375 [Verrucomicrobiota bacterium]